MLGEIIGIIFVSSSPVDQKFSLVDAVAHPIESHVDGLGAALFDRGVGDAGGAGIVGLYWGGRLRVAQVFENCA